MPVIIQSLNRNSTPLPQSPRREESRDVLSLLCGHNDASERTNHMTGAIIAIGGGEIRRGGTPAIDREIVRLARKKKPKLLFIPTASSDAPLYCKRIQQHFGDLLKCKVESLLLLKNPPSRQRIRKQILSADIIYVGGGNTLMMMRLWRRLGVDKALKQAYEKGVVLSGISAGSICWFDSGHSDSMSFYNPRKWKYINVKGLGLIHGTHCPHYDGSTGRIPRRKEFGKMIRKIGGVGIAIQNHCAIEFVGGQFYKVITSKAGARAYKVYKQRGQIVEERIPQQKKPLPLQSLSPFALRGSGG
jgi:dipeptidase E